MSPQAKHTDIDPATPIQITVYRGAKNTTPTSRPSLTWDAFGDKLEALLGKAAPTKEALTGIGPYRLRDGGTRNGADVEAMGAVIALDVDHGLEDLKALLSDLRDLEIAAIVHTSPSDPGEGAGESRRVRIYILSEAHDPQQCGAVRRAAAKLLGLQVDEKTLDRSHFFFAGKLRGTPDRELYRIEGEPLSLELLELEAPSEPRARAKALQPIPAPTGPVDTQRVEAVAALIDPHFEFGQRRAMARGLGGWLAGRDDAKPWSDAEIAAVIELLPSDDTRGRVHDALAAAKQRRRGEITAGWAELERLVKDASVMAQLDEAAMSYAERFLQKPLGNRKRSANTNSDPLAKAGKAGTEPMADSAKAPVPLQRTDLGNARRLVSAYGDSLRYFEARKTWYVWDDKRWEPDNTGEVIRAAKDAAESLWTEAKKKGDDDTDKRSAAFKWAAQCQDRARLMNMIELAKSEPGIPVVAADLDAHPWLLNVQNGTLDLRTGELREPDPALLMTKCCATKYNPDARSELWEAFVKRTTGGDTELAAYIQRSLGYALYGAWAEKAFWFGYGPPDGAKSTLLGAIGDVLGDYHVAAAASTWMVQNNVGGNRGDVTRLLGARFVTSLEIRPGLRFDEELVKKVTGGDTIVAAGKYENEIQFPPTFALWMGANDRPTIRDDDEGMWSRMRCVPFTNPVPDREKDPHLREKLTSSEHAPAVLAWLVAGCLVWQREGIGKCEAVTTATKAYRADMNRAGAFFEECCELGEGDGFEAAARAMRAAYDEWCRANGVRNPLAANALGHRLRALGATGGDDASKKTVTEAVGKFPATRDRFWSGVRLRER
ncbi:MAG: phage/plasmid primase, P4 family [Pseudomonadota bacterium]